MAKIIRSASAAWAGGLKDGKGSISLESGAMKEYPYGFAARFEGQKGTNPEELLGAAHAGCFTKMDTQAKVTLEQVEGGFAITAVHLTLKAKIPGTDQAKFTELANKAKAGCPVSKVLKANITRDATLEA
jgi:osmotically inducible protein OsmC